jgi:hypothetical protein
MGDYTKLIVNCSIRKVPDGDIESFKNEFLSNVSFSSSAYHCGGEVFEVSNDWHRTDVTFVTQLKYSRGLEEFIEWLRPQVVDGFGEADWFALSCTEHQAEPTLYFLDRTLKEAL